MFQGPFVEARTNSVVIEKIEGVVSARSFNALLQWLYVEKYFQTAQTPKEEISEILEFVRFADMCGVTGMEETMAMRLSGIFMTSKYSDMIHLDHLLVEQIESANILPMGHAVRAAIARASVQSFLTDRPFKFAEDIQRFPNFAADLLKEVHITLSKANLAKRGITFEDPVTRQQLHINKFAAFE